ncbi:hypothetical protein HAX54_014586 [Datura stramonium]|uniref:Uncharacterized protein n=1 Tax=Datura stramonium TaxID=4076 RepID=A0ABS8TNB7_DATST|nr:hypothetical protein [Datura stramonium]
MYNDAIFIMYHETSATTNAKDKCASFVSIDDASVADLSSALIPIDEVYCMHTPYDMYHYSVTLSGY